MNKLLQRQNLIDLLNKQNASLPYQTNLSPQEQEKFANWAALNNVPVDLSKRSDYDMPGFYKAMEQGKVESDISPIDQQMHYTDKFKTPYHETLSQESQYAPAGAPNWQENMLVNPDKSINAIELPTGVEKIKQSALERLKGLK